MQSPDLLTPLEQDAVYIEHLDEYIHDYYVRCTSIDALSKNPAFIGRNVGENTVDLFQNFGSYLQHYYGTDYRFTDFEKFKYYIRRLNLYTEGKYQRHIISKSKYTFLTGQYLLTEHTTVANRIIQRYRISTRCYNAMNTNRCWKLVLTANGRVDNKATVEISLRNFLNFKIKTAIMKYWSILEQAIKNFKKVKTNKWIDGYLIITEKCQIVESPTDFYPGSLAALKLYENYKIMDIKFLCKKIQNDIKKAEKWYKNMTHPIYNLLY